VNEISCLVGIGVSRIALSPKLDESKPRDGPDSILVQSGTNTDLMDPAACRDRGIHER
jgi:hypothetical protein